MGAETRSGASGRGLGPDAYLARVQWFPDGTLVAQLQSRLMQLQKVCNHPKAIALTIDRETWYEIYTAALGHEVP